MIEPTAISAVHPSDPGLRQGLPSTRRETAGHDDVRAAAPVGEDPACVAQASVADPLDLRAVVPDDQVRPCLVLRFQHPRLHRPREDGEDRAYGALDDISLACVRRDYLTVNASAEYYTSQNSDVSDSTDCPPGDVAQPLGGPAG